jgi:hypothetical protein
MLIIRFKISKKICPDKMIYITLFAGRRGEFFPGRDPSLSNTIAVITYVCNHYLPLEILFYTGCFSGQ